eukprot:19545_1
MIRPKHFKQPFSLYQYEKQAQFKLCHRLPIQYDAHTPTKSSKSVIKTNKTVNKRTNIHSANSDNIIQKVGKPKNGMKAIKQNETNLCEFECPECHKRYKHFCNLKSHFKIHTSAAHVCEFCDKPFGRKANYIEHRRIHTGETPFKCNICRKQFKQKHAWKVHMKIHI